MNNITQSVVYACMQMDSVFAKNEGFEHDSWYDYGPGGMIEATSWMEETAIHILMDVAWPHEYIGMFDCEWYYEHCENFGGTIAEFVIRNREWPDTEYLIKIARYVLGLDIQ